ncbi:MAG: hypothetical protein BWY76_00320 [bacterium ADurb.Bin429]|nr:MAG: hypothetical protein BWY76_00320 [bacterium ADurb.Bin429]
MCPTQFIFGSSAFANFVPQTPRRTLVGTDDDDADDVTVAVAQVRAGDGDRDLFPRAIAKHRVVLDF